jgi:hypothetical protein
MQRMSTAMVNLAEQAVNVACFQNHPPEINFSSASGTQKPQRCSTDIQIVRELYALIGRGKPMMSLFHPAVHFITRSSRCADHLNTGDMAIMKRSGNNS